MNEIQNETLDKMVLGIKHEADERIAQTLNTMRLASATARMASMTSGIDITLIKMVGPMI